MTEITNEAIKLDVQDIKMDVPNTQVEYLDLALFAPNYVPVDTHKLQEDELITFMNRLGYNGGYDWDYVCEVCDCHADNEDNFKLVSFYSEYPEFNNISVSTAIKLYNADWIIHENDPTHYHPLDPRISHFRFPTNKVRAAFHGKAFRQLKLLWSSRKRELSSYSYELAVMAPEYYDMFIAPLVRQQGKK